MEFGTKNNVFILLWLIVMVSKTLCKPYLGGDPDNRIQVQPGYSNDASPSKPVKGCGGKPADIYFLFDVSDGVGKEDFKRVLQYASDLVPTFDESRTRIGVATYNSAVSSKVYLGQYHGSQLQTAIQRLPFEGGMPDTGSALRYMRRKAFSSDIVRKDADHLVIVFTNGFSGNTNALLTEARRIHKSNVTVFAVYPSQKADAQNLVAIASQPSDNFLFAMKYFSIVSFLERFLLSSSAACEEPKGNPHGGMQVQPGYGNYVNALKPVKGCGGKRADIYFLLDASNGVGKEDFERVLQYASDLVPTFDQSRTRIGVFTYNSAVSAKVYLGKYRGSQLQTAIQKLPFEGGKPDTGYALKYMRIRAFQSAPRDAALVIVITNGFSRNINDIQTEARLLQQSGVKVFALHPSQKADARELFAIASQPTGEFLFDMQSYSIVSSTGDLLHSSPCEETKVCGTGRPGQRPVDIVFGLDYATIGVKKAKKVLKFIKQSVEELDIGSDRVHVGVVTNDCPYDLDINLEDHYTPDALLEDVKALKMPSQADLLRKVRIRSFSPVKRARKDAQHTFVLFVDDKLDNPTKVIQEAEMIKENNIQIIVVAVGSRLKLKNLELVASKNMVVQIPSYDDLMKNKDQILEVVCKGL